MTDRKEEWYCWSNPSYDSLGRIFNPIKVDWVFPVGRKRSISFFKLVKKTLTWCWPSGRSSSPKSGMRSCPARCLLRYTTVCPVSPDPTSTQQSLAEGAWRTAANVKRVDTTLKIKYMYTDLAGSYIKISSIKGLDNNKATNANWVSVLFKWLLDLVWPQALLQLILWWVNLALG